MLAKGERRSVLRFIYYCCKLAPFQTHVNLSGWSLEESGKSRRWMSFVSYNHYLLHLLFKLVSLLYVFAFEHETPVHHMILHLGLAFGYVLTLFWHFTAYVKNLDLHKDLVQMILKPVSVDGKDCILAFQIKYMCLASSDTVWCLNFPEPKKVQKGWLGRLLGYSPQDAIVLCMPFTTAAVFSGYVIYCWLDSSGLYLYYNFLPDRYKTRLLLGICLVQEFQCLMYTIAVVGPILQLQVIAFDDIRWRLGMIFQNLNTTCSSYGKQQAERDLMSIKELQMYVLLVNKVNCYLIFTLKLYGIGYCVGTGYVAVAHLDKHGFLGVMCCLLCMNIGMVYSLVYQKGFEVQSMFAKDVQAMLRILKRDGCNVKGLCNSVMRRQLASVPSVGIKVGNFHTLETTSTPLFLICVVRNIVRMLVIYN